MRRRDLLYLFKRKLGKSDVDVGDIRVTNFNLPEDRTWGDVLIGKQEHIFRITLKNFGTKIETINLEAGFYTPDYAQDIALLYSIFSIVDIAPNCNPAEEGFVKTKKITLEPKEEETVIIKVMPHNAFLVWDIGQYDMKLDYPLIAFAGLYKECLGGYINEAGTTGKEIMYDYQTFTMGGGTMCKSHWEKIIWEDIATCEGDILTIHKKFVIPPTADFVEGNVTECDTDTFCKIEFGENYICTNGYCIETIEEESSWCSFARKIALVDITKDECTDGSIILGILILLGVIVISKI